MEEQIVTNAMDVIESDDSTITSNLAEEFLAEQDQINANEAMASGYIGARRKSPAENAISTILRILAMAGAVILAFLCMGSSLTAI
jgi:hypothetical protein